ncbi:Uma2 family endonuclease [Azospirillum halopraeferens]|uniref:Uma2 family endonuclease n=1 Tax=Azospirillum halopraeferens TaxID=34010 RepID=UPI00041018A4|nr:Uma2 family endonuclease [Azospirillum halopraeferens]
MAFERSGQEPVRDDGTDTRYELIDGVPVAMVPASGAHQVVVGNSTAVHDRKVKLPVYRSIASVREIVLIDAETLYCKVHRRLDGERWQTDLLTEPESLLTLPAIGQAVPLAEVYANVDLGEDAADPS